MLDLYQRPRLPVQGENIIKFPGKLVAKQGILCNVPFKENYPGILAEAWYTILTFVVSLSSFTTGRYVGLWLSSSLTSSISASFK